MSVQYQRREPLPPSHPEVRRQMAHEHGRLYEALERAAQLAELAGHDALATELRERRRAVYEHISDGTCPERAG